MVRLPERIQVALERLTKNLSERKTVSGVGLFGSWSRGDAVLSSDVDLLIVDERDLEHEYVERIQFEGLLFDLDYVPKTWIKGPVPANIDQKLYEINVLYDKDWLLTNTKDWMSKTFLKPGRIDVRTETHLVEADTYLSRATSAQAREDFQSARVFAGLGVDSIFKTLLEINGLPISNSHLIEFFDVSASRMGMGNLFEEFLVATQLSNVSYREAESKLSFFKGVWKSIAEFMKSNASTLDSLHFTTRTNLKYYVNPAFLKGIVARTHSLMSTEMNVEAAHYVLYPLMVMLENYAWLASTTEGVKLGYTTLFRSLKNLKKSPPNIYENAAKAFGVTGVSRAEADEAIKSAKEISLKVRQQRRDFFDKIAEPIS